MTSNETFLQELHQHYRDTCEAQVRTERLRDRYTLYTVIALSTLLLGASGNIKVEEVVTLLLKKWLGQEVPVAAAYLRCILWFALLAVTLKYFSAVVQRERLVSYIHAVEGRINKLSEEELVTREGKAYSSDYPLFQDWVWLVYTWIFPVALFLVVVFCVVAEMHTKEVDSAVLIVDCVIAASVVLSTVLYTLFLHPFKKKAVKPKP